jgi:hypothetical protein
MDNRFTAVAKMVTIDGYGVFLEVDKNSRNHKVNRMVRVAPSYRRRRVNKDHQCQNKASRPQTRSFEKPPFHHFTPP